MSPNSPVSTSSECEGLAFELPGEPSTAAERMAAAEQLAENLRGNGSEAVALALAGRRDLVYRSEQRGGSFRLTCPAVHVVNGALECHASTGLRAPGDATFYPPCVHGISRGTVVRGWTNGGASVELKK